MEIIFMLASIGILAYVIIFELLMSDFELKKKNKDWIKKNGYKIRRLCTECPYCVKFKYRAIPRDPFVQILPKYCKRFKKELNCKYDCRCISIDNSLAMYEEEKKGV